MLKSLLCLLLLLPSCITYRRAMGRDWNPVSGDRVVQAFARYAYADNGSAGTAEAGDPSQRLDKESLIIDTEFGYFVSDANELGVSVDGAWSNNEIGDSYAGAFGLYYNYNISVGPRATLYMGPEVVQVRVEPGNGAERIEEIAYGAHVGMRFWFTPAVGFVIEPSYLSTSFEEAVGGEQDQYMLKMGISVKF